MLGRMMLQELTISAAITHAERYHAATEVVGVETDGTLRFLHRSHHRQSLPMERIESATYAAIKQEFFNRIGPKQTHERSTLFAELFAQNRPVIDRHHSLNNVDGSRITAHQDAFAAPLHTSSNDFAGLLRRHL